MDATVVLALMWYVRTINGDPGSYGKPHQFVPLEAEIDGVGSCFPFLVKEPIIKSTYIKKGVCRINVSHVWHKLGFFTTCLSLNATVVLCFNFVFFTEELAVEFLIEVRHLIVIQRPFRIGHRASRGDHCILQSSVVVLARADLGPRTSRNSRS
jgi:hypothetical protein